MSHSSRSTNTVHVRRANAADFPSIIDLVTEAFGPHHGSDVAHLVNELRRTDELVPELALVAELRGTIVGFIALTWMPFHGDGPDHVLLLSPLGVRPEAQRQGAGSALVRAAQALATEMGSAIIVEGVPAYYPRFGFQPASSCGVTPPYDGVPDKAFMVWHPEEVPHLGPGSVTYPSSFAFLRNPVLIERADAYFDAAPRSGADPHDIGAFTLFRSRSPWPYYARPRRDAEGPATVDDVRQVIDRCTELDLPVAFEWVTEHDPGMSQVLEDAGTTVTEYPLLAMEPADRRTAAPFLMPGIEILPADPALLTEAWAVAEVAFAHDPDSDAGGGGVAARDERVAAIDQIMTTTLMERSSSGTTVTAAMKDEDDGIIAVGMLQPVGDVAEIVGVATLPAFRKRGLATVITVHLVQHAFDHGIRTVVLSAGTEDAARTYERVGFRRIGSVGAATHQA
jgi:predicted N-acetyltransferase YhbS/RimJ/RimL family protein N-acetyltransferase